MLATLNDKNDPHDAIEISPDIVLASRAEKDAPTLAPELSGRAEPKLEAAPEPRIAAPSVDAAVRAALSDYQASRKRSSLGKWLSRAVFSVLFAGGSAAAAIAWQAHGETVKQMAAVWVPALAAPPSQATQAVDEQSTSPAPQAQAADGAAPQAPAQQPDSAPPTAEAVAPDATPSLQSMTRDLASMGQQIEQLKANIAELKTSQELMAREMAKAPPKPAEARAADPHARMTALPPRPPAPPVRKPKPASPPAHAATYAPAPITPAQQATIVPPPMPAPAPQQTADDDGPVVRPPLPVR